MFDRFLSAYPPVDGRVFQLDAVQLTHDIEKQLGVHVPQGLSSFWEQVGFGYFGRRELYFFGTNDGPAPRDSLIAWNTKDFWSTIFDAPRERGAVWFAETSFGDQLGFRYDSDMSVEIVLFVIDTVSVYTVSRSFSDLFSNVLSNPHSLVEPELASVLLEQLGPPPDGMHFAPILSPLAGGSAEPRNIHFETANVHFRTTLATYQSLLDQAKKPER